MDEQRLTTRLVQYWNLARSDDNIPQIEQLNTHSIEDIWPYCFMVSITNNGNLAYKYEYMGKQVADIYGRDMTGMTVDYRMKNFPGAVVFKKLGDVVKTPKPMQDHGHLMDSKGNMVKYRACFVPFGSGKKGLTHIVVGLSFRVFN